ncbi:hypothetical protein WR25_21169 [Diploscapter pachys]|uniref:Transient receptor ion channel domain-containing protein n=1 Tax=Diploscapter pachys TaxID=2018661 RepID=A0A2A2KNX0_9BILA|nr:hypothetical protein WR25_21169 [Diploscapter pachys]
MLSATSRRFSRAGAVSPRPRNRNYTLANAPPPPAVKIRTHDMISPLERRFLEAAEKGDKPTIQQCLDEKTTPPLNVNVLDSMGRSALEIAVDNENTEVVELLLQQPNIRVGNALLCAIREGVYRLVEMQVNHPSITREMLGDGWSQQLDPSEAASAEYSSDISPVILAAQLNQFEILQMLLRKEATIERPHRHSCMCETCDRERLNDSLQYSLKRINTYRALASPAWMSLTSSDGSSNDDHVDVWASKLSLARLKLAIKYEQKALPKSRIGRIVRSPFMKFLYYSISFGCFLLLLTLATFEGYRSEKGEKKGGGTTRASDRGPPPTIIECLVLTWVLGMLWSEIKQLWEEGFKKYFHQWWNWLDFIMICLYLCTVSIRSSAYYIYVYKEDPFRYAIRTYWTSSEPMLVAEALFAVGNVFSFARIIYLFQTNPYLGPLQISLGCMLVDVAKFCFIFVLIISSFSIGLAQLYWYYDPDADVCLSSSDCRRTSNVFSSIADSYITLLWSLFSITKPEDTDVIENHQFTQWVGRAMFILYHCTSIIVLLNMLIAMMSHSFQIINDHADLEWKFHRTKLWMAHFDEGSSLAPPFNLVITPKSILYFFYAIYNTIRWLLGKYTYTKGRSRATIRRPGYSRKKNEIEKAKTDEESNAGGDRPLSYADIIQRLVARFIHQTKKDMKMDGVNEDDLLEIKQDISSLRYELRDDRRREIVRSSSHIDAVKRDIMRTMSSNSRRMFGGSCRVPKARPSVAEESFTESEETTDEETKLEEKEEDEKSHTSLSLLYSPPPNTALPEIVEYGTGSHLKSKEKKRRMSEIIAGSQDEKRLEESIKREARKKERKYVPKTHSVLRKTDTSFTFPKAGGSPTRVTIR